MKRRLLCFAVVVGFPAPLVGQAAGSGNLTISGRVFGSNGTPLPFSTASIRETGAERFSDENGQFVLTNLAPGSYHLRVRQLGFGALDTLIVLRADAPPRLLRVVLSPVAFKLATVTVRGSRECVVPAEASAAGSDVEIILAELQKNAERSRLLVTSYPFEYRISRTMESTDRNGPPRPGTDTVAYRSDARPRYRPGGLVRTDPTTKLNDRIMVIPVLEDLGDPEFLRTHCFTYAGVAREAGVVMYKIEFRPTRSVRASDVEGSVLLDRESFLIRSATFRLTRQEMVNPSLRDLEVTTKYREILPGVAVIGNVESVQLLRGRFVESSFIRLTERQRLVDYRFVGAQPGDTLRRE